MFDLKKRKALVTGAGQGMGVGIARCLALAGATVYVNDLFDKRAERVALALREEGLDAHAKAFDVTDLSAFEAAVDEIGDIDILVSNAGVVLVENKTEHFSSFADSTTENWHKQFNLNVFGVMNGVRAVLPAMRKNKWGRIVTVSSDAGRKGIAGNVVYGASKAAGIQLTKGIAVEEGAYGITANTVSLGLMENSVAGNVSEEINTYFTALLARTPISRPGKPADVGAAVQFLCSNEAEWITGQNIPVNGGFDTFG